MARKIGQVQGEYLQTRNLFATIRADYPDLKRIIKLGYQLERDYGIIINNKQRYYMGKTATLEYEDIILEDISNLRIFHIKDWENNTNVFKEVKVPIIIDFVYEDE